MLIGRASNHAAIALSSLVPKACEAEKEEEDARDVFGGSGSRHFGFDTIQ
jgi:hypothetical protein